MATKRKERADTATDDDAEGGSGAVTRRQKATPAAAGLTRPTREARPARAAASKATAASKPAAVTRQRVARPPPVQAASLALARAAAPASAPFPSSNNRCWIIREPAPFNYPKYHDVLTNVDKVQPFLDLFKTPRDATKDTYWKADWRDLETSDLLGPAQVILEYVRESWRALPADERPRVNVEGKLTRVFVNWLKKDRDKNTIDFHIDGGVDLEEGDHKISGVVVRFSMGEDNDAKVKGAEMRVANTADGLCSLLPGSTGSLQWDPSTYEELGKLEIGGIWFVAADTHHAVSRLTRGERGTIVFFFEEEERKGRD